MPDFIKIAKVAEKAAEELIEHNPAAQKMGLKLLEESGILGKTIKLVTKEFQQLAGTVETKGIYPNITHTFGREIRWKSPYVEGYDAKSVSVCEKSFQTIENQTGIHGIKNLTTKGDAYGADVLKLGKAPDFVREQGWGLTADKGLPNWVSGCDDWLFYQARQKAPTKVVLDDSGMLHAIEYPNEVKALAGPFKGLAGTRFEINHAADGTKIARLKNFGGRIHYGQHDDYYYEFGQTKLKCFKFDPYSKKMQEDTVVERIPEDIQGYAHDFMRDFITD